MEDDMLKAQSKVFDILCNLELIYPPAFFDIMIYLVIHLPLEALEGGPIHPWWMYPFERFMKKLKNYIQNKAKLEDVAMKFNHPNRNVDYPPPTCQFQVFRSVCKSIGLWSVIRFDHQELKKVIWYVLHNSLEIDTYQDKFKSWFGSQIRQHHIYKEPGVSASNKLFALACGPTPSPISVNFCVVNRVRFVVHSYDEHRITQNSDICLPDEKDGEMYYGQLEEILEFLYMSLKTVLFRVKWFDTSNEGHVDTPPDIIDVDEDNDIIDDEDTLPHHLADFDDKDLINVDDDDDVAVVYSNEEED
ncbi:proton-dependent oligopeptide transporter family protein [Tanacetum coccineum]